MKKEKTESPNLKLAYIAAVLNESKVESELLDFILPEDVIISLEKYDEYRNEFIDEIVRASKKYQYIYFDCEYGMLTFIKKCIEKLENSIKVIVGGTYINYLYAANCLQKVSDNAIFWVVGDVMAVISDICLGKKGVSEDNYKSTTQIIAKDRIDLTALPHPK